MDHDRLYRAAGKDGTLPSGEATARAHGRQERWGRLVKNTGLTSALGSGEAQVPRLPAVEDRSGASPVP